VAAEAPSLLVLGLGNVLCGDDGLGVVAVDRLRRRFRLPSVASLVDGGTLGLDLLSIFDRRQDAILVDAIRADRPPGTLLRLSGEEVAPAVRTRLSVHQIGVADLLDGLRLLDAYPRRLTLLGLVPETTDLGAERSAAVEANLGTLVDAVVAQARRLGYDFHPRTCDAPQDTPLHALLDGPLCLPRQRPAGRVPAPRRAD